MKLSAAEKQRQYRQRRDADITRRSSYLESSRRQYVKKKRLGKVNSISEMSLRTQRKQRKSWRESQQRCRKRKKDMAMQLTPPESPVVISHLETRQKKLGRKKKNRQRSKSSREVNRLECELMKQSRKAEKYRKRYNRLKKSTAPEASSPNTPKSKTNHLLKNVQVPKEVRKTLVFHHALVNSLSQELRDPNTSRMKKKLMVNVIAGKIMQKYKLRNFAKKKMKYSGVARVHKQKKPRASKTDNLKKLVECFLCRDDNSRLSPGKKDTITRKKIKMQKRLLCDTLRNLHVKFLAERTTALPVSYALFCRLRPFWVLHPSISDRQTCLCKVHENLTFMTEKLYQLRILHFSSVESIPFAIVCSDINKVCMYRECQSCNNKEVPLSLDNQIHDLEAEVSYMQWVTRYEEKKKADGTKYSYQATVKVSLVEKLESLLEKFQAASQKFCKHQFNIRHQYRFLRQLKDNIDKTGCVIHIDFSENYGCKYHNEIQAVHFGSSHKQATLHTGVFYIGDAQTETVQKSFCTISESKEHGPAAIWKHLAPVLGMIRQDYPAVTDVHFVSDGPCTQYKQRGNFFLFSQELQKFGFKRGTWNFLEAAHGKGAPDGIGGAIKRTADDLVSRGKDIPNAKSLYEEISATSSTIKLFFIEENDIDEAIRSLPDKIPRLPGTMRIHQPVLLETRSVLAKDVSCSCTYRNEDCTCSNAIVFSYPEQIQETTCRRTYEATNRPDVHQLLLIETNDASLIGKWVVVKYEKEPFPGIVVSVDETDAQVKCMNCIGKNRFYWPMKDDIIWYDFESIITIIPEPTLVGTRHFEVNPTLWDEVLKRVAEKAG